MITQKNIKNKKGVTLIILAITIVIMLILAGATVNLVVGEGGILQQVRETENLRNEQIEQSDKETNKLIDQAAEEMKNVWKDSSKANSPKLSSEMVPVKWNEEQRAWIVTNNKDSEWFDYSKKQWANIMLRDGLEVEGITDANTEVLANMYGKKVTKVGSMFVWIPRYAYQIKSGYHSNETGEIDIEFMFGTTNISVKGRKDWNNQSGEGNWNIHPAFEYNGTVEGIWVAKFEASQSDAKAGNLSDYNSTGGTSQILKIQPGVNTWRNISITDMFTIALKYMPSLNSHMITNYEWGAVAYLTQSIYGKNENVWINPNINCITGQAGTGPDVERTTVTYSYETENGIQASTTGNIYGIYDMSGGSWEYVAAYLNNGTANLNTNGSITSNISNYYKDVYEVGNTEGQENNYNASANSYGDAMYETSGSSTEKNSWNSDYSTYPYTTNEFFLRGGGYWDGNGTGLFYFYRWTGAAREDFTFRPVLSIF